MVSSEVSFYIYSCWAFKEFLHDFSSMLGSLAFSLIFVHKYRELAWGNIWGQVDHLTQSHQSEWEGCLQALCQKANSTDKWLFFFFSSTWTGWKQPNCHISQILYIERGKGAYLAWFPRMDFLLQTLIVAPWPLLLYILRHSETF